MLSRQVHDFKGELVRPERFELPTLGFEARNRLISIDAASNNISDMRHSVNG
ncbi:MAG: hypothetical protein NVS1B11_38050 [Terriglobales bacterium]